MPLTARALSDCELVATLLSGGKVRESSLKRARALLAESGGLSALPVASRDTLLYLGLSETQASALLVACELACRLAREQIPERKPLRRPAEVALYLSLRYQQRDQEVMGAVFLDLRHRMLGEREIFRGTLSRAAVEPREILKQCLLRGAAGVVLFHTHPSGDPSPSGEDLDFTRRMADAAAVIGVDLIDHLVLGTAGRWVSLREKAVW
ncbi:MAG TPA: DNA repair protein RadC [Thermoanaerobaculia bacterium]|nr:DNA repair protein RadC [Thermoanaerobaculia bacterium]